MSRPCAVDLRAYAGDPLRDDEGLRYELAAVYADAFSAHPYDGRGDPVARAKVWAANQLVRHCGYPGFALVTARVDGVLAGFGYGLLATEEQWFTQTLRQRLPAEIATAWVGGHGELVELAVQTPWQGQGIGGLAHDAVLRHLVAEGATTALLAVNVAAPSARALYEARGWQSVAPLGHDTELYGIRLSQLSSSPRFGFSPQD